MSQVISWLNTAVVGGMRIPRDYAAFGFCSALQAFCRWIVHARPGQTPTIDAWSKVAHVLWLRHPPLTATVHVSPTKLASSALTSALIVLSCFVTVFWSAFYAVSSLAILFVGVAAEAAPAKTNAPATTIAMVRFTEILLTR